MLMEKGEQKKEDVQSSQSELIISVYAPDKNIEKKGFAVILPGEDGVREIRPYHTSCMGKLTFGELKFFQEEMSRQPEVYAVHHGFFKIFNNSLEILVHAVEKVQEIDIERARQAKQRAEDRLYRKKDPEDEPDVKRARLALQRALNRIALWEQYKNS